MSFRTYVIRHVAFEDLGLWEPQLAERGAVRYLQAGVDDVSVCHNDAPDLLVVLGGPIGVYETEQYPFVNEELKLIRHRLERNLPTLGVCLGAQLIAAALGARVYSSGVKEIGWGPIVLTDAGHDSCLRYLQNSDYRVLHWHGDTFDLPHGATLLASTTVVKNQAFSLGKNVLALQFHAEADPNAVEAWLIGHTCELGNAKIKPNDLRTATRHLSAAYRTNSERMLMHWLKSVSVS